MIIHNIDVMPELPEVETVRAGLDAAITGRIILSALLRRPNLRYPFPEGLVTMLQGQRVEAVRRRAKYLVLDIGAYSFIAHLGMSGKYIVRKQGFPLQSHDHMVWKMDNRMEVVYHDPRRFGFFLYAERDLWATHPMIANLGVEPFSDDLTEAYVVKRWAGKSTSIKAALLDQRIIAGIGNIYACEVLFRAGIHPETPTGECRDRVASIITIIRAVLGEAIASGGSTLRNYANTSGDSGYFQHSFAVYGCEGKPCFCGKSVIERIIQSGRSTFFCPSCQLKASA